MRGFYPLQLFNSSSRKVTKRQSTNFGVNELGNSSTVEFLSNFVLKTRSERTSHTNLNTPCECGFARATAARKARRALLELLNLHDDVVKWRTQGVDMCHLCEHNSSRGWCINPRHIYIGTHSENLLDLPPEVRSSGMKATQRQLWVSTFNGFLSTPSQVARHNVFQGAGGDERVKLTQELQELLLPHVEEFTFVKKSGKKGVGKRIPILLLKEHL